MALPPLRWNARAGRYADASGRFVTQAAVRGALDNALLAAERDVRTLADRLRSGAISLASWEREMRTLVKSVFIYSYASAVGGWAQLTPRDYGRIGQEVREQYRYLRSFALEIEAGLPLAGRFQARALMYVRAARKLQAVVQSEQFAILGWDQESNIRYPGDNCPGCLLATARGWVPIGTLPPPGTRDCLSNCRCRLAYRNTATGETTEGFARAVRTA